MTLPPFPVDDATLDLLMAAINPREHGDPDAEQSTVGNFLIFMSEMGGSDVRAVQEVLEEPSVIDNRGGSYLMRDPEYHEHSVMAALVEEIRRLRKEAPNDR